MIGRVWVVAEIGSSHDGSLERAKGLIRAAAQAGATAVKGQFWSSAQRLAARRHAPELEPIYARYRMPRAWLDILKGECDAAGIEWMATCYLPEDLGVVDPYVRRWKISSFESGDRGFLAAHLSFRKPLIVSTGMMTDDEVSALAVWLYDRLDDEVLGESALLHCTSSYPCPLDQANLRAIRLALGRWGVRVGLSDHTAHEWTGALAVAAGARVIEVHLRLPETDHANPDHAHSLTPDRLRVYIEHIRLAEAMLGDGVKRPQEAERPLMRYRALEGRA